MLHSILEYIKFILKSNNQHRIHSPFVYDLVTKCLYDNQFYKDYNLIAKYYRDLNNNMSVISIKDHGAGSKVLESNTRSISDISKKAGITQKRAKLIYRIVNYFNSGSILELGTSLGISTCAISLGNSKAQITTIEGCPETASVAKEQFKNFNLNNINLIVNEFDKELNNLKSQKFDLIYIDGNHQKEATLNYFNTLLNTVNNDSVVILDDIHWSKGMTKAWNIIKQNPKVTLTIDTFFWGIVFFRTEQEKQHFIIRV